MRFSAPTLSLLLLWPQLVVALDVGDPVPQIIFRDIDKVEASTATYEGRVRIFSFADKESSDRLMAWINDAGIIVAQKHPDRAVAFINFADVTTVPRMFRGIVEPILRRINQNSQQKLEKTYAEKKIALDPAKTSFHLTPDWDGAYLAIFGIADAKQYKCWIEYDGNVVATLHEGMPNIVDAYVDVFDRLFQTQSVTAPTQP